MTLALRTKNICVAQEKLKWSFKKELNKLEFKEILSLVSKFESFIKIPKFSILLLTHGTLNDIKIASQFRNSKILWWNKVSNKDMDNSLSSRLQPVQVHILYTCFPPTPIIFFLLFQTWVLRPRNKEHRSCEELRPQLLRFWLFWTIRKSDSQCDLIDEFGRNCIQRSGGESTKNHYSLRRRNFSGQD